jgi:hypothetical protein
MGFPTSEVGYTSATVGRGDHEVHKGHVVALAKKLREYGFAEIKYNKLKKRGSCVNFKLLYRNFVYISLFRWGAGIAN